MYGRISKEHMKLIHKEFEAFNKNSFVIASLKPNDNFDSQEIEGWVEKVCYTNFLSYYGMKFFHSSSNLVLSV